MYEFLKSNILELEEFKQSNSYNELPSSVIYAIDDQLEKFKADIQFYEPVKKQVEKEE